MDAGLGPLRRSGPRDGACPGSRFDCLSHSGKALDRAAWLATACSRYRATEFAYLDVQVRELGPGLAVMSAIAEFKATIDGVARNGPLFLVDVWRRIDGAWRVSARYSSSPEPGQAVGAAVAALR